MNADRGRSLHVLTLTPFYPSHNDDAGGCFVAEPLAALANENIRNTVFAVQPFYRERRRVKQSAMPTTWLRYFALPSDVGLPTAGAFLFARIVARVRELQRSHPIDVMHAHAALPCGHAAMLLSRELGIPYVVSVHGLDVFSTEQVSGRSAKWCRRISQRVYQSSRRVICISERVREEVLAGTGGSIRTSVVYNGVDVELFSPEAKAASNGLGALSVANLIPSKGLHLLIRSTATLTAEFPALSLDIIGVGPERRRLELLAGELHIGEHVHFLGHRSRNEVAASMKACTLFALPSRYEGLGCVYLEAMASGKAVIGCRGQGIAEVIRQGSNGFLVGPENERELTLTLSMLLRDENLRKNLGRAARDTILDRFTLAEQAERLARIYRESTP